MQNQIQTLEADFKSLKTQAQPIQNSTQSDFTQPIQKPQFLSHEDTILELQERSARQKNVIIVGIPELNNDSIELKQQYDCDEALKYIRSIFRECPNPIKTMRLGKFIPGKNRSMKVCFDSAESAKYLLRKQPKSSDGGVRLYYDQTPAQRNYMNSLRDELSRREKYGEHDLKIKYIKGVPKIIKFQPKNSQQ